MTPAVASRDESLGALAGARRRGAAPAAGTRAVSPRVIVVALVAVASLARAIGLDSGLWIDEIYSLVRSFREPLPKILTEYWGDNHHPFYAVLAHASRAIFGESPWTLRLPAFAFGVATVPMLYALGRRMVAEREALLASLLLALSYHHVWFSQNARGYSAIAFLTVATMWALKRGVSTGEWRYYALYGVLAGLGAYTHLTMVFVVIGHALAALLYLAVPNEPLDRRAVIRGAALAFGLGAAVTLALYAPMMRQVIDYFVNRPSTLRGVSTPGWAFVETIRVLVLGLSGGVAFVGALVVAGGAVVGVSGLVSLWKRERLMTLAILAPALVTIAGAALARGTMYPRFFFYAIAPALLVVVHGAFVASAWLAARVGRPALGHTVATWGTVAVIALSAASLGLNYRYPKQDFEGAMRYVLESRAPGDQVVSVGLATDPYRWLYQQPWGSLTTTTELDSVRALGTPTWVLWTFPRYLERAAPGIDSVLQRECPSPRVFPGTVGGGNVLVCTLNAK